MASEPLPEKQSQTLKVHKGQTASQGDDSNDRESVVNHLRQELYASFEAGPLPSPEKLAAYGKVLPGLAHRIVVMAEKEQESIIEQRASILKLYSEGQRLGTAISILGLIIGALLIALDKDAVGIAMLVTSIALLVGAAIYKHNTGKTSDKQN